MATPDNIPSLMIPMWGEPLLVPNTAVAEVIGFIEPEGEAEGAYLGTIYWRGLHVPMLNLEEEMPSEEVLSRSARIAIFNTILGDKKRPFVALLVNGIPRLSHITEADIRYASEDDEEELAAGFQAIVMLGQEIARLVEITALEEIVSAHQVA